MSYLEPTIPTPARKFYRLYEVNYLARNGDIKTMEHKLPAEPVFERACAAFGRGALIDTPHGATAIEDLLPGDFVKTPTGTARIKWIGSTVMIPNLPGACDSALTTLVRVQTSAMGQSVMGDVVLGPQARVARRLPDALNPNEYRLVDPMQAFGDGMAIPITPAGPIRMYQMMLSGSDLVTAHGIEVETLLPEHLSEFASADDWSLLAQLFVTSPTHPVLVPSPR